ncbi:carbonic anhydrase 9-like [Discoglossus pictus]
MGRCSLWVLVIQICFLGYCVMSREASGQSHQDAHHPGPAHGHWNYQDKTEWKSDFPHCEGKEQSPININTRHTTFDPNLKPIRLSGYNLTSQETLTLKNNGHTVVLDLPDSLEIIGGLSQTYRAAQLHFHWGSETSPGSEHTVNGHRFHGEVHVVHYSTEYKSVQEAQSQPGGLAVLAAFIQISSYVSTAARSRFSDVINGRPTNQLIDARVSRLPLPPGSVVKMAWVFYITNTDSHKNQSNEFSTIIGPKTYVFCKKM